MGSTNNAVVLACLLLCGCDESQGGKPVKGGTAILQWTAPDAREDGSDLQPHEIGHYEIERGGEAFYVTTETHVDTNSPGVYRVKCVDVLGRASLWSNEVRVRKRDLR